MDLAEARQYPAHDPTFAASTTPSLWRVDTELCQPVNASGVRERRHRRQYRTYSTIHAVLAWPLSRIKTRNFVHMSGNKIMMANFGHLLEAVTHGPVVDHTALSGEFSFRSEIRRPRTLQRRSCGHSGRMRSPLKTVKCFPWPLRSNIGRFSVGRCREVGVGISMDCAFSGQVRGGRLEADL